jgi:hypothetical protein
MLSKCKVKSTVLLPNYSKGRRGPLSGKLSSKRTFFAALSPHNTNIFLVPVTIYESEGDAHSWEHHVSPVAVGVTNWVRHPAKQIS